VARDTVLVVVGAFVAAEAFEAVVVAPVAEIYLAFFERNERMI